jgi:nucleoid-associated protein YgaU
VVNNCPGKITLERDHEVILRSAWNGGNDIMWKSFKQSLDSPDSYVSLALGLAVVLVVGMITFNYFKAKMQSTTKSEAELAQQEEAVSLPTEYTVKEGDTLWTISEKFYKSGYNWVDVLKVNNLSNPNYVEEGQVLTIPDVEPVVPAGEISDAASVQQAEKKTYTVVRGDSLWKIAVAAYGNGYKWVEIARANRLANPDIIHTGNVLTLP